jgi:two-component system OmpR family response regulator
MAKVGVFGTEQFYRRLVEGAHAGGDVSWVRLGPVEDSGAIAAAAECAVVVAEVGSGPARRRVQDALPRLQAPCLVVAGQATPDVLAAWLRAGAAEAVSAELSPRELVAHVRALRRRPTAPAAPTTTALVVGGLAIDRGRYEARVAGRLLPLTPRELSLLVYLVENQGRACRRAELADAVWEGRVTARSRTLDVHVGRLRGKLEGAALRLVTVPGVGYRLEASAEPGPDSRQEGMRCCRSEHR